MKFTVKESRWLRGGKDGNGNPTNSVLQNEYNHRCCMGFLAEAVGIPEEARLQTCYFSSRRIEEYLDNIPAALRPPNEHGHGPIAEEIYVVNDAVLVSDEERKQKLTDLFAKAGVEVEFVP